jgi:hypothetical protein
MYSKTVDGHTLEKEGPWPANKHLPACKRVTKYVIHVPDKEAQCKHSSTLTEQLADSRLFVVWNTQGKFRPLEKVCNAASYDPHNDCKDNLMKDRIAVIKTWQLSTMSHKIRNRMAH